MKTYLFLGFALLSVNLSLAQNSRSKAEVFINIEDRGTFTVYLDDEFIGTTKGKFRFYDVYVSSPNLTIKQGNKEVYNGLLRLNVGSRLVLNFSIRRGLKQLNELRILRNGQYALDDFNNYIGTNLPGNGSTQHGPYIEELGTFDRLLGMVKKESFDDQKVKLIQVYAVNYPLSTTQINLLLANISNDDQKLMVARSLLPVVIDPQNYFTLKDSFTFMSTKESFLNDLQNQSISVNGMRPATFEQLKNSVKNTSFDDDRIKLIQAAVANAAPSTAQVGQLLALFSFEDNALNCAKLIYHFVKDKHQYFTLKDNFKFRTTQDAFLNFLAGK